MNKLALFTAFATTLALHATDGATAEAAPFWRSWPGLSCQAGYAQGSVSYLHDNGFHNNDASGFRTAMCPLVTDSNEYIASSTGLGVQIVDQHYSAEASCRMTGNVVWAQSSNRLPTLTWGQAVYTIGSSPVPQWLTVTPISGGGRGFNHSVLCYLPPAYQGVASSVLGYDAYLTKMTN